jgi:hypothetical protein
LSRGNEKTEVIDKIKKWLEEESYQYGIVEQQYADFQANLRGPNMSVIVDRNKADMVSFETYREFSAEDKKAFAFLKPPEKKQNYLVNLQVYLLMMGVEFILEPNLKNLAKIHVKKRIYFDGFTKDRFVDYHL